MPALPEQTSPDFNQRPASADETKDPQDLHSWRGSWPRPVSIDEKSYDPLTIARMTDHNVHGTDTGQPISNDGRFAPMAAGSRVAHLALGILLIVAAIVLSVGTIAKVVLLALGIVGLLTGLSLYYGHRDIEERR